VANFNYHKINAYKVVQKNKALIDAVAGMKWSHLDKVRGLITTTFTLIERAFSHYFIPLLSLYRLFQKAKGPAN
tara:strand:+ start:175 stop:396 length:222 start_codon:yes stop_codon:yes gene_type:complete